MHCKFGVRKLVLELMLYTIWNHFYTLKNGINTRGGVLFLLNSQTSAWSFTKSNTPPWMFFTFLKLYKWHQIA